MIEVLIGIILVPVALASLLFTTCLAIGIVKGIKSHIKSRKQ